MIVYLILFLGLLNWGAFIASRVLMSLYALELGASAAGVFVSFASLLVYTFGIFLKPWTEEFGWSRESVSAAFGIAAMTVAVCSPPLGYLLDRSA